MRRNQLFAPILLEIPLKAIELLEQNQLIVRQNLLEAV